MPIARNHGEQKTRIRHSPYKAVDEARNMLEELKNPPKDINEEVTNANDFKVG